MKKKTIITLLVIISLFFIGCEYRKGNQEYSGLRTEVYEMPAVDAIEPAMEELKAADDADYEAWDQASLDAPADIGSPEYEENGDVTSDYNNGQTVTDPNRKLIKRVNLDIETRSFEELLDTVNEKIEQMQGYIEYSQINGKSYEANNQSRSAQMTIRIPSSSLDQFVDKVKEAGNVTSIHETVDDVTLNYVDIESRKKALITEQERLLELVSSAENIDVILVLENRLSEIRYDLERYESQLRTYDNQVEYSTVSLWIQEVERVTEPVSNTVGEEILHKLSDNLYNLKSFSIDVLIWFVSSIPYFIIIGIIALVAYLVYRKVRKKQKQKNTEIMIKNEMNSEKVQNEKNDENKLQRLEINSDKIDKEKNSIEKPNNDLSDTDKESH